MEVIECIKSRRSVRAYKDAPVPMEHIRAIVEAATWAPSGYNRQPWRFIAIVSPEIKQRMAEAVRAGLEEVVQWPASAGRENRVRSLLRGYTVFNNAPVAIAVLVGEYSTLIDEILRDHGLSFEERFKLRAAPAIQAVAAAIQNMLLRATSLGYGTCWATGCLIAKKEIEAILGVESPWSLVVVVPVGVPDDRPKPPRRKPVEEVLEVR